MLCPLHDLQIGIHGAVVDGGSHLADAAAQLALGLAGHIDNGLAIALLSGALSDGVVEGEHLAGLDHSAVDGLAGQLHIVGSATAAAQIGGAGLRQAVPEQHGFQLVRRQFRQSLLEVEGEGLPGRGHGQLLVGVGQRRFRFIAYGLRENAVAIRIVFGVLCL